MHRVSGFTLWECLCVVAIMSVVAVFATPGFEQFVLDTRRTSHINAFVTAIQLARSEAAKRAQPIVVCKTLDSYECGGKDIGYEAGWMVFVNEDDVRPAHRSPTERMLWIYRPERGSTIRSNRDRYYFRPFRRRSTNGTVTFCDRRGADAARAVIVSYTGRPRVSATGPGQNPLVCPD